MRSAFRDGKRAFGSSHGRAGSRVTTRWPTNAFYILPWLERVAKTQSYSRSRISQSLPPPGRFSDECGRTGPHQPLQLQSPTPGARSQSAVTPRIGRTRRRRCRPRRGQGPFGHTQGRFSRSQDTCVQQQDDLGFLRSTSGHSLLSRRAQAVSLADSPTAWYSRVACRRTITRSHRRISQSVPNRPTVPLGV